MREKILTPADLIFLLLGLANFTIDIAKQANLPHPPNYLKIKTNPIEDFFTMVNG